MHPHPPGSDATIHGLTANAFASLFQSIDGLRNRRALIAMLGCLALGVLVAGLFTVMAARLGYFFGFLGGVAMFVAVATGINAAGVLLMDQARGVPPRPLDDAVVYGLLCIPKFAVLALGMVVAALAVFILLAIVYAVCKIPLLGPILFVLAFPLSVVVAGLTLCSLLIGMFLALPAIWEGGTITRAVAQVLAIARTRLVESVLLLVVVGLLAGVVGLIVFGVLFLGLMPAIGLSAAVLGGDGLFSMLGMMRHASTDIGATDGNAYAVAAGIGSGLLWALAGSLVSLVTLLGLSLVYLRVTEELDVGAAELALRARLADAKRQAAELGQRARETAQRARDQARRSTTTAPAGTAAGKAEPAFDPVVSPAPGAVDTPTTGPSATSSALAAEAAPDAAMSPSDTSPAPSPTCPQCSAPVNPIDVFCGVCGHRLK